MKVVFYLLTFLLTINSLALPRVKDSKLNFAQNEALLSRGAIDCVEKPQNEKLSFFLNSIDDINCNSKEEPEEFCKCVRMISSSGFHISEERKEKTTELFKEAVFSHLREDVLNKILSYENFNELDGALSSTNYISKCLSPSSSNPVMSRLLEAEDNGDLSAQERMKKGILTQLRERLQVSNASRVNNDEDYINFFGNQVATKRSVVNKSNIFKNRAIPHLSEEEWNTFSDDSFLSLIKVQPDRMNYVNDIVEIEKYYRTDMTKALRDTSTLNFGAFFIADDKGLNFVTKMSSMYNKFGEVGMKLIDSECSSFNNHIESIFEKANMDIILQGVKGRIINPTTEDDYNLLSNVNSLFEKELNSKNMSNLSESDKNETRFDLDRVYCQVREKEIGLSNNKAFSHSKDSLVREYKKINHNLEDAKDKLRDTQLKLEKSSTAIKSHEAKIASLTIETEILDSINEDAFVHTEKGVKMFTAKHQSLLYKLNKCKEYSCDVIKGIIADNKKISLDKFKSFLYSKIPSQGNGRLEQAKAKLESLLTKKERLARRLVVNRKDVDELSSVALSFDNHIIKSFGSSALNRIVALSTTPSEGQRRKSNSLNSYISDMGNDSIEFNENVDKRKRFISSTLKNIVQSEAKTETDKNYNNISTTTISDNERKALTSPEALSSTSKEEISSTKFGTPVSRSSFSVPNSIKQASINKSLEKREDSRNDNFDERDMKIKELEKSLAAVNQIIERTSKKNLGTTELDSEEQKVQDLKFEIEKQKLLNEKIAIQKKVENLKTKKVSSAKVIPVSSPTSPSKSVKPFSSGQGNSSSISSSKSISVSSPKAVSSVVSNNSSSSVSTPQTKSSTRSESLSSPSDSSSSKKGSNSRSVASASGDGFVLSSINLDESSTDSRVVVLDFNIESLRTSERNDLIKGLFIEGEESILLELPNGEKLLVENTEVDPSNIEKSTKKNPKPIKKQRIYRDRMKYEDLKKMLKVGAAEEEF